jgi:hypothetical protein
VEIPGGYEPEDTPQIVFFSFDSTVNLQNFPLYQELFAGRTNPNGAEISVTFFIAHEYNHYNLTHELYRQGHEIALNSITRTSSTDYWKVLNETMWAAEVVDQRSQVALLANITESKIQGMRAPFLQIGGDRMYKALFDGGLAWEASRPTYNIRLPGLWPYTNDYESFQDCQIPDCPRNAYPGFWTVPIIDLIGGNEFPCPLVDNCNPRPKTADEMFALLHRNFQDQYMGNRAPFGVFGTSGFLLGPDPEYDERKEGYKMFLDYLRELKDVYIVSISKGLEWVKDPVPLDQIDSFLPWQSEGVKQDFCPLPRSCRYDWAGSERYMMSCTLNCPPTYPWLFNPLGTN